jgi:hypothetical protein
MKWQHPVSSDPSESGQVLVRVPREVSACRGLVALLGQRRVHQVEPRSHLGGQVRVRWMLLVGLQRKVQHVRD